MITLQFELKIETKHFQLQTSRSTILPGTWNLRRLRTANLEKDIFIFKLQKGGIGLAQLDLDRLTDRLFAVSCQDLSQAVIDSVKTALERKAQITVLGWLSTDR